VPQSDVARVRGPRGGAPAPLTLYIEGARDRSILRAWAYRFMPARARDLLRGSVILGGRQPARAIEHFERRLDREPDLRALCILDRDDGESTPPDANGYALDFFTWGRRHIESYLLVPDAIRRALGLREGDGSIARLLEGQLPAEEDESGWRRLDAKRVIAPGGVLPRALGRPLPLARIARATREAELHADVHELFDRLRQLLEAPRAGRS
jgi:hypothetical protein